MPVVKDNHREKMGKLHYRPITCDSGPKAPRFCGLWWNPVTRTVRLYVRNLLKTAAVWAATSMR